MGIFGEDSWKGLRKFPNGSWIALNMNVECDCEKDKTNYEVKSNAFELPPNRQSEAMKASSNR